ncbi:MAG: fibronectin type III domain-containing protein [Butyricicoccus sp.]
MKKRILSLAVAACVIAGILPVVHTAAQAEDTIEITIEDQEPVGGEQIETTPVEPETAENSNSVALQDTSSSEFSKLVPELTGLADVEKGVTVRWNAVDNAEKYRVYRKSVSGSWKQLAEVSSSKKSYTDSSASRTETYVYSVRAVRQESGNTVLSKRSQSLTRTGCPVMKQTQEITGGLKVRWQKTEGADSYQIYRKLRTKTKWKLIGSVTTNSFQDKTAKYGLTYCYTISAVSDNNGLRFESAYDETGVTGKRLVTVPSITALSGLKQKVTVQWKAVSAAEKYQVCRRTSGGTWTVLAETKQTSYRDDTADPMTTYYYQVRSVKAGSGGTLIVSENTEESAVQRPGSTTMTSAKKSGSGIKVTWSAVPDVQQYRVYRRTDPQEKWSLLGVSDTNSYTDETAIAGTYYYTVRAVSSNPNTFYGGFEMQGISYNLKLATPELKRISNVKSGIRLEWGAVDNATGYIIYRKKNDGDWKKYKEITKPTTVVKVDTSVSSGASYSYSVSAVYQSAEASSRDKNGLTIVRLKTPELNKISKSEDALTVRWKTVSYADGYIVYRRRSSDKQWEKYAEVASDKSSFKDESVSNGGLYQYTVRATNGDSLSGVDTTGLTGVYLKPVSIQSLRCPETGSISLQWSENSKADRYVLSYSTSSKFDNDVRISVTGTEATLTGLKMGTIYYLRVNALKEEGGEKYFSVWSADRPIVVDK